jgi:hypothetical protein
MLRIAKISVSWERRLGILERAQSWPEPLRGQSERSLRLRGSLAVVRATSAQFYNTIAPAGRVPAFECHEIAERRSISTFAYNNGG